MNTLYKLANAIVGRLYIPQKVRTQNRPLLVHISDTPVLIYSEIKRLLSILQPEYIVHTGDMVDQIKLELYPDRHCEYKKFIKRWSSIFAVSPQSKIYIQVGNHDDEALIRQVCPKANISSHASEYEIEGQRVWINHYAPKKFDFEHPPDYCLFGHDLSQTSKKLKNTFYLNGIEHIHVISISQSTYGTLDYPLGTNDSRLNKYMHGM